LLALTVFSLFLGVFANVAFAPHVQRQYFPSMDDASWIGPGKPAVFANYRKNLILPGEPTKAYLQIAAPDQFTLFVNGAQVPGKTSAVDGLASSNALVSASTTEVFDIAPYLGPGKNVLAVAVKLWTRPERPLLIARGSWMDRAGAGGAISSDSTWRVVTFEDWQPSASGRRLWYQPEFIDSELAFAVVVRDPPDRPMQYLDMSPALYQEFPRGNWIWHRERAAQNAAFRRTFDLQGENIDEAWIGLSSDATYSLAVNGFQISEATTGPSMHAINIARYLNWGLNTVTLGMTRLPPQKPPRLAVALMIHVDGNRLDFSSDGRWSSSIGEGADAQWEAVIVAGAMGNMPLLVEELALSPAKFGYPGVKVINVPPPYVWWLAWVGKAVVWSSAIMLINLILVWLSCRCVDRSTIRSKITPWAVCLYVSVTGTLVLSFLFLLQYDVRIEQSAVFHPVIFFAIWGAAIAMAAAWPRGLSAAPFVNKAGSNG
jgi:hypothetical protein